VKILAPLLLRPSSHSVRAASQKTSLPKEFDFATEKPLPRPPAPSALAPNPAGAVRVALQLHTGATFGTFGLYVEV
jgi:hypothetical protein